MRLMMLCLISLIFVLPSAAQDDVPAASGEIAFVSNRDGGIYQIYLMNADGSNIRQITNGSTHSYFPGWSPDGQKIAFMREVDSVSVNPQRRELWVIDADGNNAVQLAPYEGQKDGYVSTTSLPVIWSPNSEKLLYGRYLPDAQKIEYIVVHADGSHLQVLATVNDVYQVHFLTDEALLFTVNQGDDYHVLRYDLTDDSITTLLDRGFALKPSPDGTQIPVMQGNQLTLRDLSTGTSHLVRDTLSGLIPDELGSFVYMLSWSNDGTRLAGVFAAYIPYAPEVTPEPNFSIHDLIFVISSDGTEYRVFEAYDRIVSVSPDGAYITYSTRDEGGSLQIAITPTDGTELPQLITSEGENLTPAWRPVP